jgi:hypothetical protein
MVGARAGFAGGPQRAGIHQRFLRASFTNSNTTLSPMIVACP